MNNIMNNNNMNRRLYREMTDLNNKLPIQDYFDIPINNTDNSTFNIDITSILNNKIELEIRYTFRKDGYYFDMLPPEINNIIDSFMIYYITLNITLVIPSEYPFKPPLWILTNLDTDRVRNIEYITTYFIDKIKCHNKEDFSLVYYIHKNILHFVSNIKFIGNELI